MGKEYEQHPRNISKHVTEYKFSLANTEMYLAIAAVFRRFELSLFETNRQRDVDSSRDCFTGEASSESKGIRVVMVKELRS